MQPWQERSESLRQSVPSAQKKKNIEIQALNNLSWSRGSLHVIN
jgi:hypothetical protein